MDVLSLFYRVALVVSCLLVHRSQTCPPGCSCTDETSGRSLLCMETSLAGIPADVPLNFTKIRMERSHLTELPRGAFSNASALEFLWLNFNNITLMHVRSLEGLGNLSELRLQGNKLRSVPWTAFQDTPRLKILDLKHNQLDALPENALRHLSALTYLDLSSNQLNVVSRDVFTNWPLYRRSEKTWDKDGLVANVFLSLSDNPWLCDCRLKGFVEFIRTVNPPIILMNSYLTCSGPVSKAGKFFHQVQLKTCTAPEASAPRRNITAPMGANATLTCLVKARPRTSNVQWMFAMKIIRRFAAIETPIDEETVSSQLTIPSLRPEDGGTYTCLTNNFLGNASAAITVNVDPINMSAPLPPPIPRRSDGENAYIDIRIAKQTVYGITLEWAAAVEDPAETWFTVHFGKYDSAQRESVYIGPGINSYSIGDLFPMTKYEVCVTLRNLSPRADQCVVFLTGSDVSELEQRERLIHIVVIVLAMVLAVPAGMFACTSEARFTCLERCSHALKRRTRHRDNAHELGERQGTFDSLQAASDEGLCRDSEERTKRTHTAEDGHKGGDVAQLY